MDSTDWLHIFLFYAALQLAWTIAVRMLPDLLGKTILKRIEHKNSEQLETLKASLNESSQKDIEGLKAQYSALQTSTNYISAAQSELRVKTLTAVEELWANFLVVQDTHSSITYLEYILTQNELKGLFKTPDTNQLKAPILQFKGDTALSAIIQKCMPPQRNKARLYISDRLWLIYYSVTAFYLRLGVLTNMSLGKKEYQNWRDDKLTLQHLYNVLPKQMVDEIVKQEPDAFSPTMQKAMAYLETAFLQEARKVISGSQAFADSLTDINSTLQLEAANIEARRPAKGS